MTPVFGHIASRSIPFASDKVLEYAGQIKKFCRRFSPRVVDFAKDPKILLASFWLGFLHSPERPWAQRRGKETRWVL